MRKDFGAKPYTYPQPVLMIATYGEDGKPDVMNAAWGGISDDKEISICVSESHKTTENILKKGAFTVSMADVDHMTACDYVGIVSGNKEPDKFAKAGFTAEKSEKVDAPIIKELPICVECKLKSYDKETCRLVGEIVNVSVDESVLDENGNVLGFFNEPVQFEVKGVLELIGPKTICLQGGMGGTYVKTTGQAGEGILIIENAQTGKICEHFQVAREE